MFCNYFHHPSVTLSKFKLQRRKQYFSFRYHGITVTILQIGTRDKRKTRKGSVAKKSRPLKAMQKWQTCDFFV